MADFNMNAALRGEVSREALGRLEDSRDEYVPVSFSGPNGAVYRRKAEIEAEAKAAQEGERKRRAHAGKSDGGAGGTGAGSQTDMNAVLRDVFGKGA
jgi:hypothetical protein